MKESKSRVQCLDRAMNILEALSRHDGVGVTKLAAENLLRRLNESSGAATPVGYREVFEWNADFFYEATLKMLRLMNGPGKA